MAARKSGSTVMRVFLGLALVGTLYSIGFAVGRSREMAHRDRESAAEAAASVIEGRLQKKAVPPPRRERRKRPGGMHRLRGQQGPEPEDESSAFATNRSIKVPAFWVPTEIAHVEHGDPRVTMCRLDLDTYWRNPTRTPMFRDLVGASRCGRGKSGSLDELVADLKTRGIKPIEPTGFVFHESRVGSTLVANMLGSIPTNLVFSESSPPPAVINHCRSCDPQRRRDILRKLFALMGASPFHERLFFKFQSITVPNIAVLSDAFPNTPWIFVYREPVQVMMSHFKKHAQSAPCLREHRRPRKETAAILGLDVNDAASVSREKYCAAHLAMLCASALANNDAAGDKALMVQYDSLPGALVHYVLPSHFGVDLTLEDQARMLAISTVYSKRRMALPPGDASGLQWEGDSEAKEAAATPKIKEAAINIMQPYYDRLLRATLAKTNGDDLTRLRYKDVPRQDPSADPASSQDKHQPPSE